MTFAVSKSHTFSASHQLDGLPAGHPCSRLHGHNFTIELVCEAEQLDEVGFVIDYGHLKPFFDWVDAQYDHQHLNDRVTWNPTSESMAHYLYRVARERFGLPVAEISWSETDKTWATYRP